MSTDNAPSAPNAGIPRKRGPALEQRRRRVFAAWAGGKSVLTIADEEKVNHGQISRDLAAVLARLAESFDPHEVERARIDLLGRICHMEAELLAAWERSKQPKVRRSTKTSLPGGEKKGREDVGKVTEGRDGNPKFPAELRALWELKAKVTGIIRPPGTTVVVSQTNRFDDLTDEEVDERVRQLDERLPRAPRSPGPPAGP